MKTLKSTVPFIKTAACPASTTLLSFCWDKLSAEAAMPVRNHLRACDFCNAELPLLAHHQAALNTGHKTPEMPINLRILAESILAQTVKE